MLWLMDRYGVVGVFLVSFIGNSIPYSTIPYLLFIVIYSSRVKEPLIYVSMILLASLGASMGKIIVYFVGYGARKALPNGLRNNIEIYGRLFKRSTFLVILFFAASPLPDDLLYIPVGAMRYDLKRYFLALLIGKTIITGLAVVFGSTAANIFVGTSGYPEYIVVLVLIVLSIYLMYIVGRIDWVYFSKLISDKKLFAALKYFSREIFSSTIRIPLEIILLFKKVFRHRI